MEKYMLMPDYGLGQTIFRKSDQTFIPMVEDNVDYQAYLAWAEDNEALEYDAEAYASGDW